MNMSFRFTLITFVATSAFLLTGCSGMVGPKPIAELGISAHDGQKVNVSPGFMMLGGGTNSIDISSKKFMPKQPMEQVLLFVEPAIVEDIDDTANVRFDHARMADELTKATRESALGFGRFRVTKDRSRAEVIVQTRLAGMSAWGDWSKSDEQLRSTYGDIAADALQNISREGIDVLITLIYTDASTGDDFASQRSLGRIVSRKGEIVQSASSLNYGGGSGDTQVKNAKIDEDRLPQVFAEAADAAFALSFEQIDQLLWDMALATDGRTIPRKAPDRVFGSD